ncbi:uncharacterized protein BCR38DRAFT_409521 [Pseudomassariella vexata]|uniref:Uncharacterized protein n=1 Tax=Pseudomassariella vexata TaxID=1141098 RepID=A0A1Y2DXV0_9PEZI|nr:uncharacterized protein BCR38DRAFT_409521 [Pseudomassariella vexata]ORY64122.1 hypothetical protein BCR38DRAFT_409521 [Pseudomassariella vexata]
MSVAWLWTSGDERVRDELLASTSSGRGNAMTGCGIVASSSYVLCIIVINFVSSVFFSQCSRVGYRSALHTSINLITLNPRCEYPRYLAPSEYAAYFVRSNVVAVIGAGFSQLETTGSAKLRDTILHFTPLGIPLLRFP